MTSPIRSAWRPAAVLLMSVPAAFSADALPPPAGISGVKHVLVIGCDGMSPDGVRKADTPHMDELMRTGAFTLHARGVMPTSSSPNWASLIMGAGPEQHGVTSNDWRKDKYEIAPTFKGAGGIFPTIFQVLREQRPEARIAVIHHWDGFANLYEREAVNVNENPKTQVETTDRAVECLKTLRPALTFVHLDHVDHAGHEKGHGTPDYYAAVEEADRLIGRMLSAVKEAGMAPHTIVLVTADHGGVGTKHGNATMAEIEIPWIIAGPGVAAGREISTPVNTYDTAATIAHVLGLKAPACWIARPVLAAFKSESAQARPADIGHSRQ
ncbi:MAG: phosphodiesterase [Phycisphaerae bacterium]